MGWCSVAPGTQADGTTGNVSCGFGSPSAACSFQAKAFNPTGKVFFTGLKDRRATTAQCGYQFSMAPDPSIALPLGIVSLRCESGFIRSGGVCTSSKMQVTDTCEAGASPTKAGNPIDVITGHKIQKVVDFATADGRLKLERSYNSYANGFYARSGLELHIGEKWSIAQFPRAKANVLSGGISEITFFLPGGRAINAFYSFTKGFQLVDNARSGGGELEYSLSTSGNIRSGIVNGEEGTLSLSSVDGSKINFAVSLVEVPIGVTAVRKKIFTRVTSVVYPSGYTKNYDVDYDLTQNLDGNIYPFLKSITDSFGRKLSFNYNKVIWVKADDPDSQLFDNDGVTPKRPFKVYVSSVTLPDGSTLKYSYDSPADFNKGWSIGDRLTNAVRTSADGTIVFSETYLYENNLFPFHMTGVIDSENIRYVSWEYDNAGRAISSEHAGGVDRTTLEYDPQTSLFNYNWIHKVTNPLGRTTEYEMKDIAFSGRYLVTKINGEASSNCLPDQTSFEHKKGFGLGHLVSESFDKEGRQTSYSYDNKGRRTKTVRGVGTPEESTSTTVWHPVYRLPKQVVKPGLTSTYDIDDNTGHILSMTQTDTSANSAAPRTSSYSYSGPNLISVDGPLPGPNDTQSFTYDGANLTSYTNELGHVTTITAHNLIGAPAAFTDPNGINTRLEYDADNRLTGIIVDDGGRSAAISMTYNKTDQILTVTPPNGAALTFAYDDARRLETITNAVGEIITYTRNAMGGILSTQMSGNGGTVAYSMQQVFDEKNRVIEAIGAGATAAGIPALTQFGYDKEDNLTSIIDPRQNNWTQSFDALDRLSSEVDPETAETSYGLSKQTGVQNPLASVTDARGATTNYIRNGYGEVIREVNFEAGTTNYVRDTRGLITQMTDARGVVGDYTYDEAGRLLSVTYPASPESNITYVFDEGANGKGQLTSVTEDYGITSYSYNTLGQMTAMVRTINGQSYSTGYTYDLAGEMLSTTYPSGRTVNYSRDAAARVTDVALNGDISADILADVSYLPFGPMDGARFGDGHDLSLTYDSSYRATTLKRSKISTSIMDIGFEYDAAGDILALNDNLDNDRTQRFEYNKVSRLSRAEGVYGDIDYSYNLVGDRTSRTRQRPASDGTLQTIIEDYSYDPATFQLTEVTVGSTAERLFGYSPSGQITRDDRRGQIGGVGAGSEFTFDNDARGRLAVVNENGTLAARYLYDYDEQRISKTTAAGTVHYHYDLEGRLIAETDGATGASIREYLWLGLSPLAVIQAGNGGTIDLCDEDRIAAIEAALVRIEGAITRKTEALAMMQGTADVRTARIAELEAQVTDLQSRIAAQMSALENRQLAITNKMAAIATKTAAITTKTARIAEIETVLASINPLRFIRIAALQARKAALETDVIRLGEELAELDADIAALTPLIQANQDNIARLTGLVSDKTALIADLTDSTGSIAEITARLEGEIADLMTRKEDRETRLAQLISRCDAANDNGAGGSNTAVLYYLHTDHLGRPKVATTTDGDVAWDGGLTTPFGQGVTTMGAITQKLMFPGQYADEETGYSHNWHRTYDPTLGRYMQSDPIGLAGGLNRYAYVGGNPIGWVDFEGLQSVPSSSGIPSFPPGAAFAEAASIGGSAFVTPRSRHPLGATYAAGIAIGAFGAAAYYEYLNYIWTPNGGICELPLQVYSEEHKKNARPSTKGKHEKGQKKKDQARGGEQGDKRRRGPRKRPKNWSGPWQ